MTKHRPVHLYVATSLDGYIARQDGAVDWLDAYAGGEDYGFGDFLASVDTALAGRITYEKMLSFGDKGFLPGIRYYCFTSQGDLPIRAACTLVRDTPRQFISALRKEPGKGIWLMGGGKLVQSFQQEDLIDTYRIFVMPCLLGSGIRLFPAGDHTAPLHLEKAHQYKNGVVALQYARDPL